MACACLPLLLLLSDKVLRCFVPTGLIRCVPDADPEPEDVRSPCQPAVQRRARACPCPRNAWIESVPTLRLFQHAFATRARNGTSKLDLAWLAQVWLAEASVFGLAGTGWSRPDGTIF